MGYVRAGDILPKEILELVQQYADGQTIYIPRRSESHKSWGAGTETRKYLMLRNSKMYEEYKRGATIKELSERYFLTEKSVQRIIRNIDKIINADNIVP
ncbi:MAG: hypothetical protein K1W00_10750 [Lachnospiraceae bacterium]